MFSSAWSPCNRRRALLAPPKQKDQIVKLKNHYRFALIAQAVLALSGLLSLVANPATLHGGVYSSAQANTNAGAIDPGVGAFVTPGGIESGTASGSSTNPRFKGWATGVAIYRPAPGVAASSTNTANALGPVGSSASTISLGDPNPTNTPPGYVTLTFATGIGNAAGADFAVFENGFISSGKLFAELAYVEVSSDGFNFARFDSISQTPAPVTAFGVLDPTGVYNLAGKHAFGWGTPFDLQTLAAHPLVTGGQLDLNNVRYVRLIDIPGTGFFRDSLNNPIYDAYQTTGSGGLDLDAVGVLNAATPHVASQTTLDDIQLWAGTGTNRAAFAIHWSAPEVRNNSTVESPVANQSLVWGYRWNGTANAENMLETISAADPRLLSVVSDSGGFGRAAFGFVFDLNQNGIVGVRHGTNIINRAANGLAEVDAGGVDAMQSLDAGDLFWSGWIGPGWELWIGNSDGTYAPNRGNRRYWTPDDPENPYTGKDGSWDYAQTGMSGAALTNGSWIGLSVAGGGLDLFNPGNPGTIAYNLHKHAPKVPTPASLPISAYATGIASAQGPFGGAPYDVPNAVLGMPATDFYDPFGVFSGGDNPRFVKLVEPAFNVGTNQSTRLITTFSSDDSNSVLIAEFAQPIQDNPAHPYGIDFLVFGNAFYAAGGESVNDEANMNTLTIGGGGFFEPLKVSVSPGYTGLAGEVTNNPATWPWYQFTNGPFADTDFPTHAYKWDRAHTNWSAERMDFTKPVNPALANAFASGIFAADAIDYYTGSGGGTGFDLRQSGFSAVRYVKVEGIAPDFSDGEVDAFAVVRPTTLNDELSIAPGNLTNGTATLRFQQPGAPSQFAAAVTMTSLTSIARVLASAVNNADERSGLPAGVLGATRIAVSPVLGSNRVSFTANVALASGGSYAGNGSDLHLFQRIGTNWSGQSFTYASSNSTLVVNGITNGVTFAVVQTPVVPLALIATNGITLAFKSVAGWTHYVERTTDFVTWTNVATITASNNAPIAVTDSNAPIAPGFYRLRLELP
jgi:hypothetical protein